MFIINYITTPIVEMKNAVYHCNHKTIKTQKDLFLNCERFI